MHHELAAMDRKGMLEKIESLEVMLKAMQKDFAECARGKSACFFCSKDFTCECTRDTECYFHWAKHD